MKINLIYNTQIQEYQRSLNIIESQFKIKQIDYKAYNIDNMFCYGDISLVLGGDGTLLRAAKFYADYNIPVLGINVGRLGFLSQIDVNNIDKILDSILNSEYSVEERQLLACGNDYALNDFVVKGASNGRTSKFFLEINDKLVCDYIADGLIISTPTGSTAYCLSAGGPILHPNLDVIVIVPICPHTLNVRPLVIPATEKITIKTDDELLSVLVDGCVKSNNVKDITVTLSEKKAKLAFTNSYDSFYTILRNKLNWGVSPTR